MRRSNIVFIVSSILDVTVMRRSNIVFIVSSILDVTVPSGFRSVVMMLLVRTFPVASLYACDHGFKDFVTLQYSFHEFRFSLLISY